jgi:hypothetical protein
VIAKLKVARGASFAAPNFRINLNLSISMLPDFPEIKRYISQSRSTELSAMRFGDPVLSKIRSHRQHEGDRFTIIREDGSTSTSQQQQLRSENMEFSLRDIQARGEVAVFETFAKAHQQIAIAGRRLLSERLNEEPINRVDAGGRRFSPELYLEMLETLEMSFDEQGNWNEPDFWQERPNPAILKTVKEVRQRFNEEPELKSKLDTLLDTPPELALNLSEASD